jgi:hypothetical protein
MPALKIRRKKMTVKARSYPEAGYYKAVLPQDLHVGDYVDLLRTSSNKHLAWGQILEMKRFGDIRETFLVVKASDMRSKDIVTPKQFVIKLSDIVYVTKKVSDLTPSDDEADAEYEAKPKVERTEKISRKHNISLPDTASTAKRAKEEKNDLQELLSQKFLTTEKVKAYLDRKGNLTDLAQSLFPFPEQQSAFIKRFTAQTSPSSV